MAEITSTVDVGGTGDYASLELWDIGEGTDLPTDTNTHVVTCKTTNGNADTTQCSVDSWTTDTTHFITIQVDSAHIHDGKYNTAKYRIEANGWTAALVIGETSTHVIGIQVKNTTYIGIYLDQFGTLEKCISQDSGEIGFSIEAGFGTTNTLINCAAFNSGTRGFLLYEGVLNIYNCVSLNSGTYGFAGAGYRTANLYNCYAGGSGTADYYTPANATMNYTTCYSEDESDGTTPAVFSTSSGAYFTNVTAGSEDPHIGASSGLIGVGTDNPSSGLYLDDIIGVARVSTWDVGVFEYVSGEPPAGLSIPIAQAYYRRFRN